VHFHLLALDGVYESHGENAPLAFVPAPTPTPEQLQRLLERTAKRIRALVAQAPPSPELSEVQAPLLRVLGAEPAAPAEPKLVAQFDGFNLHAGTSFAPHERVALERFCRYALRGPLAQARLSARSDGKLVYRLKAPKPDGTTHVVFSPLTLLQRLSWLVPLPRIHLTRYHGVFAPAHPWRSRVVPSPPPTEPPLACARKRRWIDWADLLKRVFALEVLACACGGRRRVLSVIKDERVARRILDHLGLPSQVPLLATAAPQPQGELWPTGPPVDELAQAPAPDEYDQRSGTIDFAE
jgi:hypothetical protein